MLVLTLLLMMQTWIIVNSECGSAPSVDLNCRDGQIYADWNPSVCYGRFGCEAHLICNNGTYIKRSDNTICPLKTFNFNITLEYYYCNVTVSYKYYQGFTEKTSLNTTKSCTFNKIELQYDDHFEVGRPHEIICNLYTGKVVNSDNVSISWNGPNGVIANESSRITVIPTTSDGHIHTSILQFLYISEEDENTSYNCTASLPGENESVSESFTINNLSIPKPTVNMSIVGNQTEGDKLSLRCDASITKGITSNIHFVWKINDTAVTNPLSNVTILMYTSFLNISSLNLTDNYNVYYCQAVLSTSGIASDSASITLNVIDIPVTTSSTIPPTTNGTDSVTTPPTVPTTPPADSQVNPLAPTIISLIVIFVIIGILVALFSVYHHKWKRPLVNVIIRMRKRCSGDDDQHRIPDFDDHDFSVVGKDQASTIEYVKIDRSHGHSHLSKIDEECGSITDSMTTEEMLDHVYGDNISKKQHQKHSKLDNGYYSDSSVSPKHCLPSPLTDTEHSHSNPSDGYIQSDVTPYYEETVALQQHTTPPPSDPNEKYSSMSQLQGSQDLHIDSAYNDDSLPILSNEGEYFADSIAIDQCDASVNVTTPVDMEYLDYNTAVSQYSIEKTVPCSHDAETVAKIHKPLVNSDSFPYAALKEDSMPSTPSMDDQLGVNYIAHNDNKGKNRIFNFSPYITASSSSSSSSQAVDGVYIDHNFPKQHNNAATERATIEQTQLHDTNSESSGYIKETNDGGYIASFENTVL